jgi:hypothetical protein
VHGRVLPLADVLKDIDRQTKAAAELCARAAAAGVFTPGCPVKTPSPILQDTQSR